jgi:hypothetical protein
VGFNLDRDSAPGAIRLGRSPILSGVAEFAVAVADADELVFATDGGIDDGRIELLSRVPDDNGFGHVVGEGAFVQALGGQGVIYIRQPVDFGELLERGIECVSADFGVRLYDLKFTVAQPPGFEQHVSGMPTLPIVVQRAG